MCGSRMPVTLKARLGADPSCSVGRIEIRPTKTSVYRIRTLSAFVQTVGKEAASAYAPPEPCFARPCLARKEKAMQNPFLIGTKIYLRPLEKEDAPSLRTWINDPEVRCTLNMYRPMNLRDEEEFIAKATQSEHDLALGIVVKHGDKLIGATGLHRMDFKNRHASFG